MPPVQRYTTVDPGIWQALRGGGAGSFGIVVSMTFDLHLPPAYVTQVTATYVLYEVSGREEEGSRGERGRRERFVGCLLD